MCRWKSPRAMPFYRRHRSPRIRRLSREVLASRDEARRMELLTSLAGVSVPVGSAILTLIDPRRYGVLDIRVWQLLVALGVMDRQAGRARLLRGGLAGLPGGAAAARARAKGAGARVELTLFEHHRRVQRGRLYDPVPAIRPSRRARA